MNHIDEKRVMGVLSQDPQYDVDGVSIRKATDDEVADVLGAGGSVCLVSMGDDQEYRELVEMDWSAAKGYGKMRHLFFAENGVRDDYKMSWAYSILVDGVYCYVSDWECHKLQIRTDHRWPLWERVKALRALRKLIRDAKGMKVRVRLNYGACDGVVANWSPETLQAAV